MLILASQSPRRKELLEQAGLEFEVIVPNEDEKGQVLNKNNPENYVKQLSLFKALDVFSRYPNGMVIGADTVVVLGNEILEKP
ncbi:MAG: septum formation inhibitor Maf, partial [Candidatus Phytoplasma sp.]|nr:septum formation inhibitor Maf [Phytoplasma sp.]